MENPADIAEHYSVFRVSARILLTGHSHQAWPDVGFAGQMQAWRDAAEHVDEKWDRAFARADEVRRGFANLLDEPEAELALGANTHDLVVRWLSALDLSGRPRLVTTDGEFHTIRRQVDRLGETGVEIVRLDAAPVDDLASRLAAAVDDRTAAVLVSSVLYRSGHIVPGLDIVMKACQRHGAELLVDAYHALNATPFSVGGQGLEQAFITGGGYKYCQLGEGNAFLRIPPSCRLRPVVTGWFAEFAALESGEPGKVAYGSGANRFAGATYDPVSHYRAATVFAFFADRGLTADVLRRISRRQIDRLAAAFDALDADPALITRDRSTPLDRMGGFLVLHASRAEDIRRALRARQVWTDVRGNALRLGPAPYVTDAQLDEAVEILGEVVRTLP